MPLANDGPSTPVVLVSPDESRRVTVHISGITPEQYQLISDLLGAELQRTSQTYIGVANAMVKAVELCPNANPADLWVHLIYNQFRYRFKRSDQSWKRVGGQALEQTVLEIYNPRVNPKGISLRFSKPLDARSLGLVERGLGGSKTDLILEGKQNGQKKIFGVIHSKASIAERLTDDAPASVALIEQGYWSSVVTMDNKMFPPPHGDGIVYGELGITKSGDKRRYFEIAGQFNGCFSFNLRTQPSAETTPSGSKIYSLSLSEPQPDILVQEIVAAWEKFQEKQKLASQENHNVL
jgi:hypothetical protein